MLDKEYKFYRENQSDFIKKYKGKFLLIKGEQVVGAFDTREEAYNNAVQQYKLGTFLIQECIKDDKEVTQTFHSRVTF